MNNMAIKVSLDASGHEFLIEVNFIVAQIITKLQVLHKNM